MAKRRSTRKPARTRRRDSSPAAAEGAELIVIAKSSAGLRARHGGTEVASMSGADVSDLARIIGSTVRLVPLFGNEERLLARSASAAADTGRGGPDLSVFYKVEAPVGRLQALANELRRQDSVEAAYVKPPAEPPMINEGTPPDPNDAPPVTPNFTASQVYLGAAPAGIEALWAHNQQGGKGNGIRIIDIEGAWRFDHEDLTQVQGGVVGGTPSADIGWRDHGTAVIGVFGGDENGIGVTGISPSSNTRAISIFGAGQGSAKSIRDAADLLNPGEIILIELHRPGPRHNFQVRQDQLGYIAVEWWEDDWAAIRYATNKGVIVVEAAGNGAENLDDGLYSVRPAGFPNAWTNPFNRANRDSGAIVVGAGAPPPGTHGRDHGPDRSRLGFSNYGALVDAQGWGREVTTTGYGWLQGGGDERLWYTDQFSGTSSASPVVVGAVACVQGNRLSRGLALHTPAQMRNRLRTTGSPQTDAPGRPATQRIGNRPNLRSLMGVAKAIKELAKEVKVEKVEGKEIVKEKPEKAEIKETKEVKDGKEVKVEKVEGKETGKEKLEKSEIKETKEVKEKSETKEVAKEKPEVKEQVEKQLDKRIEKQIEKQTEKQIDKQLEKRVEKQREGGGFGTGAPSEAIEARLGALEAAVMQIAHFISGELRPDLSRGALTGEQDLAGTQQQLDAAGKAAKDSKDLEKLGEQ